jgi:hypothetical protein
MAPARQISITIENSLDMYFQSTGYPQPPLPPSCADGYDPPHCNIGWTRREATARKNAGRPLPRMPRESTEVSGVASV